MSANFDKLRLRYQRAAAQNVEAVDVILELTSLNIDVNQTTVGAGVPFTTEMSFEATIDPASKIVPTTATFAGEIYDLTNAEDFGRFLQDVVFDDDQTASNPQFEYMDMNTGTSLTTAARANLRHTTVAVQSASSTDSLTAVWLLHLKFLGSITLQTQTTGILYPQLVFGTTPVSSGFLASAISPDDPLLEAFNAELKTNFELLLLPDGANSNTNPLGKVADEIADSFADLSATIASKLSNTINARLQPSAGQITYDLALWMIIQKSTQDLSFTNFLDFMDEIFCGATQTSLTKNSKMQGKVKSLSQSRALPFMGVDGYHSLKVATEAFVMVNCMTDGVFDEKTLENLNNNVPLVNGNPDAKKLDDWWKEYKEAVNGAVSTIPYLAVIRRKLKDSDLKTLALEEALQVYSSTGSTATDTNCFGIIQSKLATPCFLELVWSYWMEESMLVQGLNVIGRRFQNIKGPGPVDPLAHLEIDPLRPLSNLMWGYLQDEQHRLTVRRRAYEYDHHYGITLQGTAVQNMRFADSRSKFIEAFHTLLNLTNRFYRQADDMTVQPDAFPILNALKEVHLVLSEGAHNQYGDLPSVARAEMLMQQWLLARPEFREFLPTRIMVAYPEPWMDRVAALNNLMGWTKTNVSHFRDLGVFGEQLLLSIRFGDWTSVNNRFSAANWANFWRPQIQAYIHAYRAVTGVDLTAEIMGGRIDAVQPSVHLQRRLLEQRGKVA